MISPRGRLTFALAASLCALPAASPGGPDIQIPSSAAAARARALALFYYGCTQAKALQRDRALAAFEQLLALDPGNTDVAMRAAKLAAGGGERSRGRILIDASLAANPDRAEAYLNLARYLDLFQPEGGEAAFAQRALEVAQLAEERFPGDARVCELLVDLHLRGSDREAAAASVRRFAGRAGDAGYWLSVGRQAERCYHFGGAPEVAAAERARVNAMYGKALGAAKGDPTTASAVANYHIEARQYSSAMKVLAELVRAHPELGLEREKLVRVYRIEGKAEQALAELRTLVAAYPNEARTQRLMAELLADAGDYEAALLHRARAVQLGGAEAEDYIELAAQLADHVEPPRYEEALRWLDRGIALSPITPRLHYMRGVILGYMERHAEALAAYQQAERLGQVRLPALLDEAFYYRSGSVAERAGQHAEAEQRFRRAVELVPPDQPELAAKSLNNHGYMLLELGRDIDAAGALIRRAVELDPQNPVYLDSLGWYYFKKGQHKKALVELRNAKRLMGEGADDAEVRQHIDAVKKALAEAEGEQPLR